MMVESGNIENRSAAKDLDSLFILNSCGDICTDINLSKEQPDLICSPGLVSDNQMETPEIINK